MEPAYLIRGTRYPIVEKFRLGDPALVCQVTGLKWNEFFELLANADDGELDPRVQTAMIAVAVARVHRGWSRDKVVAFCEQLEFEDAELETPQEDEEEPDPTPPAAQNGAESSSSTSPKPANGSAEPRSSQTPTGSGSPGSVTTSPESLPVA
jgi:hypothetical protein